MDEAWERAVETARGGENPSSVRSLILDGALKCSQVRLPSASLLQQFSQLRSLSIANVGLTSLADFPSLPFLERLVLSDNRIAGGLEHLVEAGLKSLRDLDLSNNKIQFVQYLSPLAQLNLVSLDLYECPITRLPQYRSKVFNMIKSLQYLDNLDSQNNDRPESDEEEEDEDDVEDELEHGIEIEGDEDDDTVKFSGRLVNSKGPEEEDEDAEDDEKEEDGEDSEEVDEEDEDTTHYEEGNKTNYLHHRIEESGSDKDGVDDDDAVENVEVHDVEESEEETSDDDEGEQDEEEDDGTDQAPGQLTSIDGEIDAHGDEDGELGGEEEDDGVANEEDDDDDEDDEEDDEDDEEDYGTEYLARPIGQAEDEEAASDFEPGEDEGTDDEDVDDEGEDDLEGREAASALKRKRSKDEEEEEEEEEEDESEEDNDRAPKH